MQKSTLHPFKFSKKIQLNFEGGELSSDTGLLLVHEFCECFGVQELLEEYLPEDRKGDYSHQKPEILYQQIMRIIAGYPSNNAAFHLQDDPVLQKIHKNKIASSPTCCRLEQGFSLDDMKQLQQIQEQLMDRAYEVKKSQEVIFDIDTTYDPASSNMHGTSFNTHYGETGFSPLVCFDGKTGDILKGHLRPGKMYCSKKVVEFYKPLLKKYKKLGIPMKSRADSGFACPEFYEANEEYDALYYIKFKMNAKLKKHFTEELLTEEVIKKRKEVFTQWNYKAGSWDKERRLLLRLEWKGDQLFPIFSAIITNDTQCTPQEGFEFYNGRATVENSIKEGKHGFSWDHLSNESFEANSVRFQLFLTAFLLIQLMRRLCFPEKKKTLHVQTIRTRLIKVASRVVKNSRSFIIKCASCFPFKEFFLFNCVFPILFLP